jgi:hypothetical protein
MAPTATHEKLAEAKKKARAQLRAIAELERRTGAPRSAYESHRDRQAARSREQSEATRDIGELPPIQDLARMEACLDSFRAFCETYLSNTFTLTWSEDHLEIIAAVEAAVINGERLAFAMPRGSGKTSLVEAAALWALLFGHQEFVAIVGSDEGHALTMLESIKVEAETNELILADFPGAVFPIVALDRIHQRSKGQTYKGKSTHIKWKENEVQFPSIPGSPASGGIIRVAGITGRIRGMTAKRASDGRKVRPGLVLIDDPQTDESARSPKQVTDREAVIQGAILGLGGPGRKVAALATVTCIAKDDLADRLLDRNRHPGWQGRRMKLVYEWPTATALWEQYAELRRGGQRAGQGVARANQFYAENQVAMDAGSRVAWPARKADDELSAIQHAWNLRIDRGEAAFFAEYQNEPIEDKAATDALKPEHVTDKVLKTVDQSIVPAGMHTLTSFVDVQQNVLYWAVLAWGDKFRGHFVDYGVYPDQARSYFTKRDLKETLQKASKQAQDSAAILAGLEALTDQLLNREFGREDEDGVLQVRQLFIDANWAQQRGTVRDFCRRNKFGPRILPTHGRYIGPGMKLIGERDAKGSERVGSDWMTETIKKQQHVVYDSNLWKSFVISRLKLPKGDPRVLTLPKGTHDLLTDHLTSSMPEERKGKDKVMTYWALLPGREDDWLDCLTGAAVAASFVGISDVGTEGAPMRKRRVYTREALAARRAELMARQGM